MTTGVFRLSLFCISYFFEVSPSDPILGITHRNQTQQTLATTGSESTITSGTLHWTLKKSDDKKKDRRHFLCVECRLVANMRAPYTGTNSAGHYP